MKTSVAISAVVLSVLVTVVIEEKRIADLRAEVIRLRALPPRERTVEPEVEETPPVPAVEEPAEIAAPLPEPVVPAPVPVPSAGSGRRVPDDFPEPDAELAKALAASPSADLHYQLGLTNRERAYLESLVQRMELVRQDAVGAWLDAGKPAEPPVVEQVEKAVRPELEAVRGFFQRPQDFELFRYFEERRSARNLMEEMRPLLDGQGVALDRDQERLLVEALHAARVEVEALDWQSAAALDAVLAGGAEERFESDWQRQGERLAKSLPEFLEPGVVEAVLRSRERLKESQQEALKVALEVVGS